jgi:Flp pilus assembly pilin Flp
VRERLQMTTKAMKLLRCIRTRSGATLFEYAVILFLVSIVAVLIFEAIGGKTNNMLVPVNDGFNNTQ